MHTQIFQIELYKKEKETIFRYFIMKRISGIS